MIGRGRKHAVWAYAAPVDLRKGFDGLSSLVERQLGLDPLSGDLFLFVSRNRIRAKVLVWDGTGLCVYAKRLEQGRFAPLWREDSGEAVRLTSSELDLFLEGSQLVGKVALSPPELAIVRGCNRKENVIENAHAADREGARHRGPASGLASPRA